MRWEGSGQGEVYENFYDFWDDLKDTWSKVPDTMVNSTTFMNLSPTQLPYFPSEWAILHGDDFNLVNCLDKAENADPLVYAQVRQGVEERGDLNSYWAAKLQQLYLLGMLARGLLAAGDLGGARDAARSALAHTEPDAAHHADLMLTVAAWSVRLGEFVVAARLLGHACSVHATEAAEIDIVRDRLTAETLAAIATLNPAEAGCLRTSGASTTR